jgi:hypothetical protein
MCITLDSNVFTLRYLILILLSTCNYSGIIISKEGINSVEVKLTDYHYVLPVLSWSQYDTLEIGDTILIDKKTLRVIR